MDGYSGGAIVGSLLMGAVLGLLPLILGNKKGKKGLAIGGFLSCVVGSFILGLFLSIPACITFTAIILATSKKGSPGAQVPPPNPPNPPIPPNTSPCAKCGNPLGQGQAFCPRCGTQRATSGQSAFCPKCGSAIEPGNLFCNKCGVKTTL